jgi:hypothetical protein
MRNQPEPELELERVAGGEGRERERERGGRLIVGEETGEREREYWTGSPPTIWAHMIDSRARYSMQRPACRLFFLPKYGVSV